jgi:hypothetical protein
VPEELRNQKNLVRREKMKNTKNMVRAAILMAVMTMGTTFANAGIIIAKDGATQQCTETESKSVIHDLGGMILEGIIIAKTGIIIAKEGIIIAKDGAATCDDVKTSEGIIIA